MNIWREYLTVEQHRQHLLEQAENARLAASARARHDSSKSYRLLLANIGRWLVSLGERMQQPEARRNVAPGRLRTQW